MKKACDVIEIMREVFQITININGGVFLMIKNKKKYKIIMTYTSFHQRFIGSGPFTNDGPTTLTGGATAVATGMLLEAGFRGPGL